MLYPTDPKNIEEAVRLWLEPGHVYELRCPKAAKYRTISGYFDDPARLVSQARYWS